jgi:hypothetical protein
MRDRSVEARQERQPIVQYFTALNSPLPSNRPSKQAFSTMNGFLTQPLSYSIRTFEEHSNRFGGLVPCQYLLTRSSQNQ